MVYWIVVNQMIKGFLKSIIALIVYLLLLLSTPFIEVWRWIKYGKEDDNDA